MCEALYELFADELELREKQGVNQGICLGISQGKEQMASLLLKLISAGRSSEVERALREPEYYDKLAKELGGVKASPSSSVIQSSQIQPLTWRIIFITSKEFLDIYPHLSKF